MSPATAASALPENGPRVSEGLFWPLQVAGWLAYFSHGFLAALAHGKPAGYWVVPLAGAIAGFILTLGLRQLLRWCRGMPPRRMLVLMIAPVLACSVLMELAMRLAMLEFCTICFPTSRAAYVAFALSNIYVLLAWIGLYLGIRYYRQLQDETRRSLSAHRIAHQAQLKMLRYQLNPHFLFNTLNAISTLVLDRDNDTANRMVQRLSAFLRHSLDSDPMQRVTLRQELDALMLYLDIEKLRFAERLRIETQIADDCWTALLPSLLLQPLVENAIKYAIAPQVAGGRLRIEAERDGTALVLRVIDDGPGVARGDGDGLPGGCGVGLRNTRERLRVLYGADGGLDLHSRDGGVEVVLRLPFEASHPTGYLP